ncbi:ATP-binding protein [Streptomyces sp. NPDC047002]|uniref:ATP-binding protein n=1 Tax=Streptomyces sp. NPDC047002 TaxID=3155475 RepID=UPI003454B3F5
MKTLRDRLETARRRAFVGRQEERDVFASALAEADGSPGVFYVHGIGGVGKSALLRQLSDDARAAGRVVTEIDGRLLDVSPPAFLAAVGSIADGTVLVVDTFEYCQDLETWLREVFLPGLPHDCLVLVASRFPPDPAWTSDLAWSEALYVMPLGNLHPGECAALMERKGVPERLRPALVGFSDGHPLALSLASEVAVRDDAGHPTWKPGQDVVSVLLPRLVGEVPSPQHRNALAVCALAEFLTEDLLRAVLPAGEAADLFAWLTSLPFTELSSGGVFPHDVVRNALESDLQWRDQQSYAALHQAVRHHLTARVQAESGARATHGLLFLLRRSPVMAQFFHWHQPDNLFGDRYRDADRQRILDLAEEMEGPELAGIASYWLDHSPESFEVYRRASTGRPVGFSAWLKLTAPRASDRTVDPVVDAAWAHVEEYGSLQPGEYLGISRFVIDSEHYEERSPVMDLMLFRNAREWVSGGGLAWSFCIAAHSEMWEAGFAGLQHFPLPRLQRVGATDFGLFARNWRRAPLEPWLDQLAAQALSGRSAAVSPGLPEEFVVLSRKEFTAAVRSALRLLHSDSPADNVLLRTQLFGSLAPAERRNELRVLLLRVIRAMASDPALSKPHRVLDATFLHSAPTQEAVAQTLGLPFTTYRRHLTRGIEFVSEQLWRYETGADVREARSEA